MKIGIVGSGPAGIMAAIKVLESSSNEVFMFDFLSPLSTILPTGGGRCNLSYAEFDNNELLKYYPRGGKFLLSVFSRFSVGDSIDFFEKIGVKTYIQEDLRIFPESNSSKDVREKLLAQLNNKKIKIFREKVLSFEKKEEGFCIETNKNYYFVDKLIFAGGIKKNYEILKKSQIDMIEPKPALCALNIEEKNLYSLSGVVLKNIVANFCGKEEIFGDLLITHNSISGPLAYKISSLCAYEKFPYNVTLNFVGKKVDEFDKELIPILVNNSKKNFVNILSEFVPHSFAVYLLKKIGCDVNLKASQVTKEIRYNIAKLLSEYKLTILMQKPDGEIVTAGGVNIDFVNPKTMEYKNISGLYFCGEVLNVDGFTGGFNLQFCWSSGFLAGNSILNINI